MATAATAAELERTHLKVVGEVSLTHNYKYLERPFWEEWIPKASNGRVTADLYPADQMGLDNATILRLLKQGVMDVGTTDISRLAADDPRFEGADLAGPALTIETARAAARAYQPIIERIMEKDWNVKVLHWGSAPPQVFWCREAISGLGDLKGKKIRVFNKTMVDFVNGVGGTAVNITFAEVVPALQRGIVDCAVTGTMSGNSAGWPEVTTHLYPMYLGWAIRFSAMNLNSWKRLNADVQKFLLDEFAKYEERYWDYMDQATKDAVNCNIGKDPCTMGEKYSMTLVPVKPEEAAEHKRIIETAVLKGWAKRVGPEAVDEWNATVGKVLDMTAPRP
jgi:TRAP-type C4-dicarboxylate transport system substrate-binding protein